MGLIESKQSLFKRSIRATQDGFLMNIPQHIAIIMDGNGRWAKARGRLRIAGHRAGIKSVREVVQACGEWGVKYLTLYSFSVENWKRPRSEVSALMSLLKRFLRSELAELMKNGVRLQTIGRTTDLPLPIRRELQSVIRETKDNKGLTLVLALSYGGRAEIIDAVQEIAKEVLKGDLKLEKIDESVLASHLYTRDIPDPELLIRTSGEMRVSNFLLWQISYSEIWVTETLWPDFNRDELWKAIEDYSKRNRRFGGV